MPTRAAILDEYMGTLLSGQRAACRRFVLARLEQVDDAAAIFHDLLWPAMERVEALYRGDKINAACEHMATRIIRAIADQVQLRLTTSPANGKRIVIACAEGEPEELGAHMCADLFEAGGWEVYFLGGGVPNDETLSLVGQLQPHILLIFGTQPQGVPGVRHLIDLIREIGVNPTMNIMVSGGVFNRADGLWKEVHADLSAVSAREAVPIADAAPPRKAEAIKPGAPKKRRRRRRSPLLAAAQG